MYYYFAFCKSCEYIYRKIINFFFSIFFFKLFFVLNNEDLIKKFSFFEKLHTGYIDYSFLVEENSKNNFVDNIFVGRKKII